MSDATPPDIFAGNPARHAELDQLVNRTMAFLYRQGPQGDDSYAYLLVLIVENSDNTLDGTYSDPDTAVSKLQEDSSLKGELCDAWKSKSYREIRNLGEYYPRSSSATPTCNDRKTVDFKHTIKDARYFVGSWYKCAAE